MIFGDMRRVELGKYLYLLLDIFNLVFRALEIDDLYGHRFLGTLVVTGEYSAGARSGKQAEKNAHPL